MQMLKLKPILLYIPCLFSFIQGCQHSNIRVKVPEIVPFVRKLPPFRQVLCRRMFPIYKNTTALYRLRLPSLKAEASSVVSAAIPLSLHIRINTSLPIGMDSWRYPSVLLKTKTRFSLSPGGAEQEVINKKMKGITK